MADSKKINSILKEVLGNSEPPREDINIINENLEKFLAKAEENRKRLKIDAEIFIGGSFAKGTMIKKKNYDVDIFMRFDKKYKDKDISELTGKMLKGLKFSVIHGSRDYYRIKVNENVFFEVIPVIKVKNPKEAENITDLSYFHVAYAKKKIKSQKVLDDIKLAKVFCHANGCYGAESYINGFSGYSLELLIYHYGSFLKFITAVAKIKDKEKEIIDIEKLYKNKNEIMLDLNSSKLKSPIILIDPTYRQRNALSALNNETFDRFKKTCAAFMKNPSISYFEIKKIDLEKVRKESKKKGNDFIAIRATTGKQEGDIAGSKLLKFFRHLGTEIEKYFEIKNSGFEYDDKHTAEYFFAGKKRKELILSGPETKDKKENISRFKKRHKTTFVKGSRIYAREKINFNLKEFFISWTKKNSGKIEEMAIEKLDVMQ